MVFLFEDILTLYPQITTGTPHHVKGGSNRTHPKKSRSLSSGGWQGRPSTSTILGRQ
jgi:hypothetical protein